MDNQINNIYTTQNKSYKLLKIHDILLNNGINSHEFFRSDNN